MIETIVSSTSGLTLLGGGEVCTGDLSAALSLAPDLVAADRGASVALAAGLVPRAVIGDLDSLPARDRAVLPPHVLHHVAEQDSTDFDKVLARVSGPFALGVGFLGRRLDHQLANLNALARLRHMPCLLIGPQDVVFASPPGVELRLGAGTRVSLFPLAPLTGRSEGLHWPIEGLRFTPWAVHGTSNRVADDANRVRLQVDAPGMIVILPREALGAALEGLRAAPPWPGTARAG
jgi:thiamine pyrophosphokinase